MDIEFALKEYGLTDKEIKVYLSLLKLGSVKLQELSKRVDLPRTTIYNTLNYLILKGLVSYIIKKSVKYYETTDPNKLISKIEEKKDIISSVLPELKSMYKTIDYSSVEIFQGTKGLSTILSDVFKTKQLIKYFGSYTLSKEVLKHLPSHYRSVRISNEIPAKIIIDNNKESIFETSKYKNITQIRYNSKLKDFPAMIFIYGNKVAIYTLKKELIGIIINNEQIAFAMDMIFEFYWNSSKN